MSEKTLFPKLNKKQTLADQMAATVREMILDGTLPEGAALPTEPELAEQFGVSRAVVRDATRILMAQGLVEVEHGRGVFVTQAQNDAFGEALLLALQRAGATVWDVEQFEQIVFSEVAALAAVNASDEEIAHIQRTIEDYMTEFVRSVETVEADGENEDRAQDKFRELWIAIYSATHNRLFEQLARPLTNLRSTREWQGAEPEDPAALIEIEGHSLRSLGEAIAARDPERARVVVKRIGQLPPEAIEAMRATPVGEKPHIPISITAALVRERLADEESG